MKYYLSIDPGGTTGFALFDSAGMLVKMGKIKGGDKFLDQLEEMVKEYEFITWILEAYRNRPGTTHSNWSKNETSQHIGAIKRIARKAGIPVHEQEPSPCLPIGLKFLGMGSTYKKDEHVPDDVSALAHGTYYLRKNRIQK